MCPADLSKICAIFFLMSYLISKINEHKAKGPSTLILKVTFKTDILLAEEDLKIYSCPVGISKSLI